MYKSIAEIKAANKAAGLYWFDKGSMSFFDSIIEPTVFPSSDGAYFISSEQFSDKAPRLFTVRFADSGGAVSTVGAFQEFETLENARRAAVKASKATPVLFEVGDKVKVSWDNFGTGAVIEVDRENAADGGVMNYKVKGYGEPAWFSNEELTFAENDPEEASEGV
jgi:hypothetical protein